jgi:tRNA splicing endonuclease
LPFQEGKPLATMAEESTKLVEASSDELISRQVLMAEEGEDDGISPNDALDMISEDEATANADDKNDTKCEA